MRRTRLTLVLLLTALLAVTAAPPARAAPPAYAGTYVIVDPYNYSDMMFLKCAAGSVMPVSDCYYLSKQNDGFLNAFTGASSVRPARTATPGANGILLRIPWCGFQTGAVAAFGEPQPNLGECHYQVYGASGAGTIYAGGYDGGPPGTFMPKPITNGHNQLNPTSMTVPDPQGGIDYAISNLSKCTTAYDVGSATCTTSILDAALANIATIASQLPPGTLLKLSVSLYAGMYTPTSVMSTGIAPFIDFAQDEGSSVSCARQPLAWHTGATSPYAPSTYEQAYTAAVLALAAEIKKVLAGTGVQLTIIKESAITSNSIEFDLAARTGILATASDPSSAMPPQGGAAIACPDQQPTPRTMVAALIGAYSLTGSSVPMTDAYEATFGYIMGFEEGLASQNSAAAGAMLSVPTKGKQVFAQLDCRLEGFERPCMADNSNAQLNWEDYYFTNFMNHLDAPGSVASIAAAAGYANACSGAVCTPSSLSVIAPARMSVVFTGLDVKSTDAVTYIDQPECWVNNNGEHPSYPLPLSYTDGTPVSPEQMMSGNGVVLGWQTQTASGQYCPSTYDLDDAGKKNGGQYYEIEIDAAAEPRCATPLNTALSHLLDGTGNPIKTCNYP